MAPSDSSDSDGPSPGWVEPFALLTLNLHCLRVEGTSFSSNQQRFASIAGAVAAEGVRAIAVQEACIKGQETAMDMLEQELEAATGRAWSQAWTFTHVAWQGTANESQEGVGVLVQGQLTDPQTLRYRVQSGLDRLAVSVQLPPELGGLRLYSVHLCYEDPAARLAQARETAAAALTLHDPSLDVLVAGDFNAVANSAVHQALVDFGYQDLSQGLDPQRIDHVFAHRGAALSALSQSFIFDGTQYPVVSDHHGVLLRLGPQPPQPVARTRLRAAVDVGYGNHISLRGSVPPLTWDWGWPAFYSEQRRDWGIVLTELGADAAFEYKWLLNDATFEEGPNHAGVGGTDASTAPSF